MPADARLNKSAGVGKMSISFNTLSFESATRKRQIGAMGVRNLLRLGLCIFLAVYPYITYIQSAYALPTEILDSRETNHLGERQSPHRGLRGLQLIPGKCTGAQLTAMHNAIRDAGLLVTAALEAESKFTQVPFSYFFKNDLGTANDVAAVYRRMQNALQGRGSLIGASCEDTFDACNQGDGSTQASYAAQWNEPGATKAPLVIFCPFGLKLKRNPTPCTTQPGTVSLGWLMIHTLSHIYSISGPDKYIEDDVGETARDVHNALLMDHDTTLISNAYAHLGSWSYDLGLGGPENQYCLSNFWRGNFDVRGLASIDQGWTNPSSK